MVVAFPGNKFTGNVAPALGDLVKSGTIRIIDLAFVGKDGDGNVVAMEVEELDGAVASAFQAIQDKVGDLINEEDLKTIGHGLEPNSSAAILVWEDVWAAKFASALREAGGVLIDIQRVPYDVVNAAVEWATQQK
jgi:uncharacterized membrane protein